MTTKTSTAIPGNRPGSARQVSAIIPPAAFGRIASPTTSPNRHARPWAQIVTKYAPFAV